MSRKHMVMVRFDRTRNLCYGTLEWTVIEQELGMGAAALASSGRLSELRTLMVLIKVGVAHEFRNRKRVTTPLTDELVASWIDDHRDLDELQKTVVIAALKGSPQFRNVDVDAIFVEAEDEVDEASPLDDVPEAQPTDIPGKMSAAILDGTESGKQPTALAV